MNPSNSRCFGVDAELLRRDPGDVAANSLDKSRLRSDVRPHSLKPQGINAEVK